MAIRTHAQDALVSLIFGALNILALWGGLALILGAPFFQHDFYVAAGLLFPVSWFFTKRAWVGIGRPLLLQPVDFAHVASSGLLWGAAAGFTVFNLLMLAIVGDALAKGESLGTALLGGAILYAIFGLMYGGVFIAAILGAMLGLALLNFDAGLLWLARQMRPQGSRPTSGAS
jgi:hypothetical protein